MKNSLAVFAFDNQQVRFVGDKPVAKDVAKVLGYVDPVNTIRKKVFGENKGVVKMATPGGTQSVTVLEEPGIYQLIFSSKLPSAKKFQQWVFEEVLPSIRKTGKYSLVKEPQLPATYLDALKQLVSQVEENEKLEKQNKVLTETCHSLKEEIVEKEPLVKLAETLVVTDKDTINIHEFAQSMNMSRNKMFEKLREIKFIQQKPSRIPYQKHLDTKRAEVYRKPRQHQPGLYDTVTVLTVKGQEYICKKFKELENMEKVEVEMEAVLTADDF